MRKFPPVLLWLAALFFSLTALAREVQFPEKTLPAFSFILPDEWSLNPAEAGNLIMFNPNHATGIVIIVAESADALDKIAAEAFGIAKVDALQSQKSAEISGCKGFTYISSMTNEKGVKMNIETTLVRVNEKQVAAASLLLVNSATKEEETVARLVLNGLKLVKE